MVNTNSGPIEVGSGNNRTFRAPDNAYQANITDGREVIIASARIAKFLTASFAATSLFDPELITATGAFTKAAIYTGTTLISASVLGRAKQEANDYFSPIRKQTEQVSLMREFIRELSPLRGIYQAIRHRNTIHLGR